MVRQFKILYDFWQDQSFPESNCMTQFVMEHLARDIIQAIRNHLSRFNIHKGITVDMIESFL